MADGTINKRRVLILSASAGTGHLKAADALEKVCRLHPDVGEVKNVDALTFTNKIFRDFYSKLYMQLVQSAPNFVGWWYDKSDEPWRTDKMRLMLDRINTRPLVKMIRDFRPDVTICTHFLPAEIISHLISQGVLQARLAIVVTDFDIHAMWLSRAFHHYFVALPETKVHLTMLGLPEDRITVSGIPTDAKFAAKVDRVALREKYGLKKNRPLLLVSAGALGVGAAERVSEVLTFLKAPAQIAVVCGRNEDLRIKVLDQVKDVPGHLSYTVLGYTNEMHDWMTMADLFIGKPGGLTTAEALVKGLPMAIFSPIPGQEERNSDHLLEKGIAIKCNELTTMAYKIDELLGNPKRMESMRSAALALAKPDAARDVVNTLLNQFHLLPITVDQADRLNMKDKARKK